MRCASDIRKFNGPRWQTIRSQTEHISTLSLVQTLRMQIWADAYGPHGPQNISSNFWDDKPSARDNKFLRNSGRQNLLCEDFGWWILWIAALMQGRQSDQNAVELPFRLIELRTFACFPVSQQRGFYFPPPTNKDRAVNIIEIKDFIILWTHSQ